VACSTGPTFIRRLKPAALFSALLLHWAQQVLFQWDIGEEGFVAAIREMVSDGSLVLKAPSYDVESGLDYLFTPTLSGWMWSAVLLSSAAILSTFMIPDLFFSLT